MSKYRCPACGATHKELPPYCRLCGHSMDPNMPPATKVETRAVETRKASMKGAVLIGLGIVVALTFAAVALGLVRGNKALDTAKDKIPGLATQASDGWSAPTAEDVAALGMTVELPGEKVRQSIQFPEVKDGKLEGWTASVGKDTTLFAGVGTVPPKPANTTEIEYVKQIAQLTCAKETKDVNGVALCSQYKAADGSDVQKVTEMKVFGPGAIEVDIKGGTLNGKDAYARTLYVIQGEKVYVLQARSVYKDIPQFDRMMSSFNVVAPAPAAS